MPSPYEYFSLENPSHICLLHVNPGSRDKLIVYEIHHVSLDSYPWPVYTALSNIWDLDKPTGGPTQHHSITCGVVQIPISPKLFSALWHLGKDSAVLPRLNAVCINQGHNEEPGQQVQLMNHRYLIYSQALVWLGENSPEMSLLLI
jgi:hypothetical protein